MTTEEKTDAVESTKTALERLMGEDGKGGAGLDDLETGNAVPRIKIVHKDGVWEDSITGVTTTKFTGIICGMIRQRVLWPPEIGDEEVKAPWCKSLDGETARPNPDTFPLKDSNLDLELVEGCVANCGDCEYKEWGSHPTRQGPFCNEQYALIVMADMDGSGNYLPSVVSMQRSALTATRKYLGAFKRSDMPAFIVHTEFGLEARRLGIVDYCIPTFVRKQETPREEWEVYAETFLTNKVFLQTWREDRDNDGPAVASTIVSDDIPDF